MSTVTITMAILMGLAGSLHCAGMCGPIVWIMPFQVFSGVKKALAITLYHFGRISVYALLAAVLHSFRSFFNPQVQQYISIILGSVLLLVGILSFLPNSFLKLNLPWSGYVKKKLGGVIGNPSLGAITAAGILNGLLPCGLVYMALSASLSVLSSAQASLFMYTFGLGTVPMMVSVTLLKSRLTFLRTGHLRKMVPVVLFAFGSLFVLRGMNLGIPYLSPKVEVAQHGIKASCCHKK
jgi:sulfite exporter TauE/SafE